MSELRSRQSTRVARCPNPVGWALLGLSALGLPLTRFAIRRMGHLGRLGAESGYGILFMRAIIMIAGGAPRRMKPLTALLLYGELIADSVGFVAGLWTWVLSPLRSRFLGGAGRRSEGRAPVGASWIERVAAAAAVPIYVLHTVRLAIYVSPGRGLRTGRAR